MISVGDRNSGKSVTNAQIADTFDQIADFCGLHTLEVQAIADDEVAVGMQAWTRSPAEN